MKDADGATIHECCGIKYHWDWCQDIYSGSKMVPATMVGGETELMFYHCTKCDTIFAVGVLNNDGYTIYDRAGLHE